MPFEWNENKRQRNLDKHGIDFVDAKAIWSGYVVECPSHQQHHGEERLLAVGEMDDLCITVVFTWRDETRRLISARKARRDEQQDYENGAGRRA